MPQESLKKALNTILKRHQNALANANRKNNEIMNYIPRAKELSFLLSQTGTQISRAILSKNENAREIIDKIMYENLKYQQELKQVLKENGYPEDYLDVKYTCSYCEDTGYIEGVKCECLKELIIKYNVDDFNSATNTQSGGFDNFNLNYYSDTPYANTNKSPRETMSEIYDFCLIYASRFKKTSPSILMVGDTGLGKTHLSLAIANKVMKVGFSALYTSAPDLFRKLQNEYYGKSEYGVDTMDTLLNADLVIIDDLGAEMENQFNISTIYNIINSRLNCNKPTIINTNLTLKEIERRYGQRVASRLMTLFKCLKFKGKDIRLIKVQANID